MKTSKFLTLTILAGLTFISCSARNENTLQKKYGPDADYFIGLQAAEKSDTKKALRHFNRCISSGSKYTARRSMEQKIKLGNIQDKVKSCKEYLELYNDDAALIFAGHELIANNEYALLLNYTKNIDVTSCSNELVKLYLSCIKEKDPSNLALVIQKWFTERPLSPEHISFYNEYLSPAEASLEDNQLIPIQQTSSVLERRSLIQSEYNTIYLFRVYVYTKEYAKAYSLVDRILEITSNSIPLTTALAEDLGKTLLSGSRKYQANASILEKIAGSTEYSNDIKYCSYLYAGRIYSKGGMTTKSSHRFEDAFNISTNDKDYDKALWYYINAKLALSTESAVNAVEKYCSTWKNPYYFDDLLDSLSTQIMTEGKWQLYAKLYPILDGYADNATTSQYAYLTGRLINLNYIKGTDEQAQTAFEKAVTLNAGIDVYYRLLAARELNWDSQKIQSTIFTPAHSSVASSDTDLQTLIRGYADFGFAHLIYPEWKYFITQHKNPFDLETIIQASELLRKCATYENNYFYYSLRMMAITSNLDNAPVNKKCFELSYPKNFSRYVEKACQEFSVDEYDMLGLIRTESFFQTAVSSSAGAVGLTQLMEETAIDCASRLKIQDLDIRDPQTNIRIGTYYYGNLVKRLDGSNILALFAYNAGPNRVRRWLKTSQIGLGKYNELPSDLFLETIPFRETREYGRKVISASAIYAWLYYQKNPGDIVVEKM